MEKLAPPSSNGGLSESNGRSFIAQRAKLLPGLIRKVYSPDELAAMSYQDLALLEQIILNPLSLGHLAPPRVLRQITEIIVASRV